MNGAAAGAVTKDFYWAGYSVAEWLEKGGHLPPPLPLSPLPCPCRA